MVKCESDCSSLVKCLSGGSRANLRLWFFTVAFVKIGMCDPKHTNLLRPSLRMLRVGEKLLETVNVPLRRSFRGQAKGRVSDDPQGESLHSVAYL